MPAAPCETAVASEGCDAQAEVPDAPVEAPVAAPVAAAEEPKAFASEAPEEVARRTRVRSWRERWNRRRRRSSSRQPLSPVPMDCES